ncbi:MAG: hypothetical protein DDT40_00737 [candidate division WS2 bacterium]|nr:hypothetical protein [Candidatus Psychracetigena formicireducens]
MEKETAKSNTLSLKQKSLLYYFKSQQWLRGHWVRFKRGLANFSDSTLFYILIFCIALFLIQKGLDIFQITPSPEELQGFGFASAGIIGASIAIIFSFSTFILQSTADLFSTQYLNKFIQDRKERYIFWTLVILMVASFLVPIFVQYSVIEILLSILFLAFLLIYSLYNELRKRINPETTLAKIKNDAIHQLEYASKELKKQAHIQNKIFKYEGENKNLSLAIQYKSSQNWNVLPLENVKYLYEIGLRLLSKNEINSFNLMLRYIHDIYLKHLSLRNGHIIRVPASFWGAYTFEDEGFTAKTLEYFESISNRIIQDKRKENIYFLLNVYENIIANLLVFKYADNNIGARGENPILSLVLGYYLGLITMLVQTKEKDWLWESIKSISKVSNIILSSGYSHFHHNQINQALDEITISCLSSNTGQEAFLKEVVNTSFNQIKIGWNKYQSNEIFWKDLFKTLKKNFLALALAPGINLSVSELYINFQAWLAGTINSIFALEDKDKQTELRDAYIDLLERWSDFLLDLARDFGLENKHIGLPIIQSVENNLRIIYGIQGKFELKLDKLYRTQFNTLSWYFHKTDKVDESFLFNLEQVQELLLNEISSNLSEKIESAQIIDLYIRLVQQHFEKVSVGYGYNHPRVIEKLIDLGLILTKYNLDTTKLVNLIDDLNKKYLVLNKEYFDLKSKTPNLMGPDEYQLCKEIHDLENDLFSYNSGMAMGIKQLLRQEITKDIWDRFIAQIKYCEGVEYTTVRGF